MTDYEIYVFLLCFIVFVLLTAFSVACISIITKLSLRLINCGAEDEKILAEYEKSKRKKSKSKWAKLLDYTVSGVVCFVLVVLLIGSLIIRCNERACCGDFPTYQVVKSSSMAQKNAKNVYLSQNGLNDQIQRFDLIRTEKLPEENELQLYDIVVYEVEEQLVIHRIVGIEEPNEEHPDCRYFLLQGDAVNSPDRFPVLYEQMRAIYRGSRTPFIGSFILFMQSPAGWLCTLLIVVAMIASPLIDKKLLKARKDRLNLCLNRLPEFTEVRKEPVTAGGSKDD